MTIRKIGGIYWLAIGRVRISFCIVRSKRSATIRSIHGWV